MNKVLLECRNVGFGYPGRTVLKQVNVSINAGDSVGVIGPNGAGKSTLVKVLGGLSIPSEGIVLLNGADMRSLKKRITASEIAVVQQEESPDFGFTVKEHVMMGRAPHHGGLYFENCMDRDVVNRAMEKSRVTHLADRHIGALSGGERQRVRIARALAQEPRILLLDEPTNHLDLYSQMSLMELLQEINAEGMALFIVSHDINFIVSCCAHLKILHDGEFRGSGNPAQVVTEENMEKWFHVKAIVDADPATSLPRITPLALMKVNS